MACGSELGPAGWRAEITGKETDRAQYRVNSERIQRIGARYNQHRDVVAPGLDAESTADCHVRRVRSDYIMIKSARYK